MQELPSRMSKNFQVSGAQIAHRIPGNCMGRWALDEVAVSVDRVVGAWEKRKVNGAGLSSEYSTL